MTGYNLISDNNGIYQLTTEGQMFVCKQDNSIARNIDIKEGLAQMLRQLSLINNGKRSVYTDLMPFKELSSLFPILLKVQKMQRLKKAQLC